MTFSTDSQRWEGRLRFRPGTANRSCVIRRMDGATFTRSQPMVRTHSSFQSLTLAILVLASALACASSSSPPSELDTFGVDTARMRNTMSVLAADSMGGRFTGSENAARAAQLIADQLERLGLEPAGDSGFFQRVPIQVTRRRDGRARYNFYPSIRAWKLLPEEQRLMAVNVVARLPGSDSTINEAVLVGAHYDHLGVRRPINGDSIYNGADDASGAVGAMEIAHSLARGPGLKRSVFFVFTVAEPLGFIGARYYAEYPAVPLGQTVAAIWLEHIGRPDPMVGVGMAWITGPDRTDLGLLLEDAEIDLALEPDPRPEQQIYVRSESIVLAQLGVPAHTLSSFSFHDDWHQPTDEIETLDFSHMAEVVTTAIQLVRYLGTSTPPQFYRGARPSSNTF